MGVVKNLSNVIRETADGEAFVAFDGNMAKRGGDGGFLCIASITHLLAIRLVCDQLLFALYPQGL